MTFLLNCGRRRSSHSLDEILDSAFTHDQVQNIASVFKKAVNILLTGPHKSANSLYLLSDQDEEQIKGWNQHLPQQMNDCIHRQIQERCELQPTAKAVESWDQSLTYQEFSRLSSSLALHLAQNHGVRAQTNCARVLG
jgi:non-ribosomal peptide synthetase component F